MWHVGRGYSRDQVEDKMEQLQSLAISLGGLGMFFVGIGVLWFVAVYADKKK